MFLEKKFRELFEVCHLCLDLAELIEEEKLEEFIKEKISSNYSQKEIKDKYRDSMNSDELKLFIELVYGEDEYEEDEDEEDEEPTGE